mgnify:CR=1 FL=1
MLRIILSGCCGKMGGVISSICKDKSDCEIVCGVDKAGAGTDYPVFPSFEDIDVEADVIIDFSHPSLLDGLLKYAKATKTPAVIATTGLSDGQIAEIKEASKEIAVFFSFNMSLGINLLLELCKKAASVLEGFDIEIIEKHHNLKIDAPSGTAIMLAEGINSTLNNKMIYEYDRHARRKRREPNEIGIHAVRGGTIVGEHEVMFCGRDEIITLSHSARSKEVFAAGAVSAAQFIAGRKDGLYSMKELVEEK